MGMAVGGLMSGLDTEGIISKMMDLERRPVQLLQNREAAFQVKLTAYGSIKSILNDFKSAVNSLKNEDIFSAFSAVSTDNDILTASASNEAGPGSHSIVVKQLAQSQSVRSSAFINSEDSMGTGTISIRIGSGDAVEIAINEDNSSPAEIARAINDSDAGVSAGIVDDGLGNFYLTLTADETGADNTISVTIDDDDGVNNDAAGLSALYNDPAAQNMFETGAALNSRLTVDGIDVERSGNSIDDLFKGVTLTLNEADISKTVDLNISHDIGSIKSRISAFADAYNSVADELSKQQSFGKEGARSGTLIGDSAVRPINSNLQALLGKSVSGIESSCNRLAGIGISRDLNGKLQIDDSILTDALSSKLDDVKMLFTADSSDTHGIAGQLYDYLDGVLNPVDGTIASREKGLQNSIDDLQERQISIESRITKREEILWDQFNSLELLLGNYQATSNYLGQQISALANLNEQIANR